MSCKKTIQEWRHAIDVLTSYAIEFSGMEDKILPLLKYSYDSLKGEQIRSCLLYCALFPEDDQIPKEKLVESWICEGIIDGSEDIEKAENKGYDIIGSLVGASLLMDGFYLNGKACVSMHDVVREMAKFLCSRRLISRTRCLEIWDNTLNSSEISFPEHMGKLRDLSIRCRSIPEIKMGKKCSFLSLVKVRIEFCECLRKLTFLMFAPNLGSLYVNVANELEDIINKEKACEVENSGIVPFQKLNDLRLAYLPKLKNIYWSPLPFPCLKAIRVTTCPNLKKLPLNSKSGTHGENELVIRYVEKEWIENVEWEDEATKNRFLSSCEKIRRQQV